MTDFSNVTNDELFKLSRAGADSASNYGAPGGEGSSATPNWALYAEAANELNQRMGLPPLKGNNFGSNLSGLWKAYQAQPTWFKLALAGTTAGAVGAFGGAPAGGAAPAATTAAPVAAGSLEMAPAWTAADTAAAGGGATAAGGAGLASQAGYGGSAIGGSAAEAGGAGIAGGTSAPLVAAPAVAAPAAAGGLSAAPVAATPLATQLGGNGPGQYPTDEAGNQLIPPPTTQSNGAPLTVDQPNNYWRMAGQVLPSIISAYGSNEQRKSQEQLAAEYRAMGAPYRDRLAALYANPNAFLTSPEVTVPVQQGTDSLARALSVNGNPAGSGRALQEIQNYSANQLFGKLGQEKDRLAGFGGLSFYNQAAPGASTAAINAQGQVYGDLGYGVGNVMNPQQYNNNQSLAAILKAYNTSQGLS